MPQAGKDGTIAPRTGERITIEENPRKRRECRWRQKAGALSGLAREVPHSTKVYIGKTIRKHIVKVNVEKFNTPQLWNARVG
jgi:hypothetical protein